MAEIRQTFTADDSGLLAALKNIQEQANAADEALEEMGESQKKMSEDTKKALNESNKALDETIDNLGKKVKATKADEKATEDWKKEVEKAVGEVKILGVNVTQLISNLKAKAAAMKSATTAMGGTTKGLKALRIALISTGIGALVVALGSLATYFTKTQRGADQFSRVLKGVGTVVEGLIDRFATFGGGVLKLFQGDFSGAINEFRKSFDGAFADIRSNFEEGFGIEKARQELEASYQIIENQRAKDRATIKELNKIAEDTTKSFTERSEAAAKAIQIEQAGIQKLIENKEAELKLQQRANAISDTSRADKQKEYDIENEIAALREQSLEAQTTLQNKLNTINQQSLAITEQQRAKTEALKAAYQEFINIINDRVQAERLASLEGIERIEEERRIAIEQVKLLEAQAKAAALAAGATYDLDDAFRTLYANIEKGYQKGVEELTAGRENDKVIDALLPTRGVASNAERLIKNYGTALNLAFQEDPSAFQEVKEKMMDWLGLDDKDLAILSQSFKTLYDEVGALMTEHIDRQLEQNDRLLEAIKAQSEVIQSELEHQLELQAQGRSNNVESKRAELEELQQAEAEAMRERQRLEQQQMRAQLAADAARQISNMVTGVTSLLATEASKGVVGIGIAALAIPTFLALFRAAQSQARAAVGIGQRAYKGGPLADYLGGRRSGFVDRGGRSDIPGHGDGYRVQGTDLVIGGDEFLMNERTSRKQERFMNLMNSGALDGYNLYEFFKPRPAIDVFNRVAEGGSRALQRRQQHRERSMIDSSVSHYLKRLVDLTEGQKQRMALSDYMEGYVEIDSKGNKKIIRK